MSTRGLPAWPWAGTDADSLPRAERLLLDGIRLWPEAPARRAAFVAEDAAAALPPLDALLRALAPAAPAFGCALCPRVTPAEALVLLGCALVQRGARREGLALLLRHLPPAVTYAALPPAIHLGIALARAGLLLQNPLARRAQCPPAA